MCVCVCLRNFVANKVPIKQTNQMKVQSETDASEVRVLNSVACNDYKINEKKLIIN